MHIKLLTFYGLIILTTTITSKSIGTPIQKRSDFLYDSMDSMDESSNFTSYEDYEYDNEDYEASELVTDTTYDSNVTILSTSTTSTTSTTTEITTTTTNEPEPLICPDECSCQDGTFYVNCTYRNLTRIIFSLPLDAIEINLSHNNLNILESTNFLRNLELKTLQLDYNRLTYIDEKIFTNLQQLRNLSLTHNLLNIIEYNTFKKLTNLIELNLSFNPIGHMINKERSFLHELPESLQTLNLTGCNIVNVDENAFQGIPKLSTLSIANNPLDEEDLHLNAFQSLIELKHLDMPYITNDMANILCKYLRSIDIIKTPDYGISCYQLVLGYAYEDTKTVWLDSVPTLTNTLNASSQSTNEVEDTVTTTIESIIDNITYSDKVINENKTKQQKDQKNTNKTMTSTRVTTNNGQKNVSKISTSTTTEIIITTMEISNVTTLKAAEKEIGLSSQSINNILIAIICIAIIGLIIGMIFRSDIFGIKTKLCRTRKPPPTDQVRPAEEIPLKSLNNCDESRPAEEIPLKSPLNTQ